MSKQKIEVGEEILEIQNGLKALKTQLSKLTIDQDWAQRYLVKYQAEVAQKELLKAKKKNEEQIQKAQRNFKPKDRDIEHEVEDWFSNFYFLDEEVEAPTQRRDGTYIYKLQNLIQDNPPVKTKLKDISAQQEYLNILKEAVSEHASNVRKNVGNE